MRIEVDADLCIGSANCVHLAKGVFELDDDDLAQVVDPGAASAEDIRLAAKSCPTAAIVIHEDGDDEA
ncbi:MAG: ferredoxin [Solirubrobacteraceae bacterium]|nr:ferredoxin [Solirubrobacteraceae bacterium]MEA2278181.1 ferredoxin [Solirubrobacteraceae bacterium]MEA2360834.1 ferredoxin [Solirubrobacteraceae bacterium]MEA2393271.1 ferredoxin [Solirubrobacteraceae bacterium]